MCPQCNFLFYLPNNTICSICSGHVKIHKERETEIRVLLDNNEIKYQYWDQRIKGSKLLVRPDCIIEGDNFVIILEIDECQHRNNSCCKEQERMINIYQEFNGKNVMFIRYNPDSYVNHLGKQHKNGSFKIKRQNRLQQTIKSLQLYPLTESLSVIYLYYDNDNGNNTIHKVDLKNNVINNCEEMIYIDNDKEDPQPAHKL